MEIYVCMHLCASQAVSMRCGSNGMGMGCLCVGGKRTRQQRRVNKYDGVRISRYKVVTRLTASNPGAMRSIGFLARRPVRSSEQGTNPRHEKRVTSMRLHFHLSPSLISVSCPLIWLSSWAAGLGWLGARRSARTGLMREPRPRSRGEPAQPADLASE